MDVPVELEVRGQIVLRVPPAVGTVQVDLPPADGVAQRLEDAELAGDALHLALLVDHGIPPLRGHHPLDGHPLLVVVPAVLPRSRGIAP